MHRLGQILCAAVLALGILALAGPGCASPVTMEYFRTLRGRMINDGASGKAMITFYGQDRNDDNGIGFAGVKLFKLQNIEFNGRPVFPVAVHSRHIKQFLYKVLLVRAPGMKPILGLVVDKCADGKCDTNIEKPPGFIIDIHKTGFAAAGVPKGNKSFQDGSYQVVGHVSPRSIPGTAWDGDVKTNYMLCGFDARGKEKWTLLKDCDL